MTDNNNMLKFNCPDCQHLMEVPESAKGSKGLCPNCKSVVSVPGEIEKIKPAKEKEPELPNETKSYRKQQREKARSVAIKMKSGQSEDKKYQETIEQKEHREEKFKKIERRIKAEEKQVENKVITYKAVLFVLGICLIIIAYIYYATRPDTNSQVFQQVKRLQKNADRNFLTKDYLLAQEQYKKILNLVKEQSSPNHETQELEIYIRKQLKFCKEKLVSGTSDKEKIKQNSNLKPPGF